MFLREITYFLTEAVSTSLDWRSCWPKGSPADLESFSVLILACAVNLPASFISILPKWKAEICEFQDGGPQHHISLMPPKSASTQLKIGVVLIREGLTHVDWLLLDHSKFTAYAQQKNKRPIPIQWIRTLLRNACEILETVYKCIILFSYNEALHPEHRNSIPTYLQ